MSDDAFKKIFQLFLNTNFSVIVAVGISFAKYVHNFNNSVKGANWMGIGTDNVVKVKTNEKGEMIPEELDKQIQKCINDGKVPLAVNATSGTTVLGAYDDLKALSNVIDD